MQRAAAGQGRADTRERRRPTGSASADTRVTISHTVNRRPESHRQLLERLPVRRWQGPDHHVASPGQREQLVAHQFTQTTLEPIPLHRRVPELRHHDANPHKRRGGRTRTKDETARLQSPSLLANPLDVLAPSNSRRTWIPQGLCSVLRRKLHRQALPPLLPTPTQYRPPPTCRHPRPESVGPDPTLVPGTICRLAHSETLQTIDFSFMHKEAKDRSLTIACQRLSPCLLSRDVDLSTVWAYVLPPTFPQP